MAPPDLDDVDFADEPELLAAIEADQEQDAMYDEEYPMGTALQCTARYAGRRCCMNAGHVRLGQLHLAVAEGGVLVEWESR